MSTGVNSGLSGPMYDYSVELLFIAMWVGCESIPGMVCIPRLKLAGFSPPPDPNIL